MNNHILFIFKLTKKKNKSKENLYGFIKNAYITINIAMF